MWKERLRMKGLQMWKPLRSGLKRGIAGLPSSRIHVWVFERKSAESQGQWLRGVRAGEKENEDKDPASTDEDGQFRFSTLLSQDHHLGNFYLSIHPRIHSSIHSSMHPSVHACMHPSIVLSISFVVRVSFYVQAGFECTMILLVQPPGDKESCDIYGGGVLKIFVLSL